MSTEDCVTGEVLGQCWGEAGEGEAGPTVAKGPLVNSNWE